ncbi:RNase P/RNase MRP complex subunit [Dipsacomyces acuminosporus]|nr:RNase P/RNase MRP complex subunit [Dipsacomyces acuminosporus]
MDGRSSSAKVGFYSALPENIKNRSGAPKDVPVDPTTRKFTPGFVERTVDVNNNTTGSSMNSTAGQIAFKERVEGRALLLTNPFREEKHSGRITSKNVHLRQRAGRKTITAKEKRALKIYDIPEEARRYSLFLPLHAMWKQYIERLLGDGGNAKQGAATDTKQQQIMLGKLVKADMHGAKLSVTRAKCPNYVGITGIVAQETKNVFKIITQEDRLVVVPKLHCVFTLELPSGLQCLVYGDQFAFRASERATKKFKPKPNVDL